MQSIFELIDQLKNRADKPSNKIDNRDMINYSNHFNFIWFDDMISLQPFLVHQTGSIDKPMRLMLHMNAFYPRAMHSKAKTIKHK